MDIKIKKKLWLFSLLLGVIFVTAFIAPYVIPYEPNQQNLTKALLAPSKIHWLGTDQFGRDVFSRVLAGARVSVFSAVFLVMGTALFGVLVGVVCGYIGGKVDFFIMRIADTFLAFPGMILAIAMAGILGGGMFNGIIALLLISWPKYARLVRGQTFRIKRFSYIKAARLNGCGHIQIIIKHILPNLISMVVVTSALDIGTMMLEIAGLSFLGLGAAPPTPEWGAMMSNGKSMIQTAPWVILAPGIAMVMTVAVFNLWGDSVQDYLDPYL